MYDYDDNNKHDSIQENWEYVFSDIQRLLRGKGFPLFLHAPGDLRCLFIIGYRLNLVFDNVPNGRIFDGYAMAALFCGFSVLSGFMNNMICIGGCLTMLIFMAIKLAVSMAIGIIALPISVANNLYNIAKAGAALEKRSFFCQNRGV